MRRGAGLPACLARLTQGGCYDNSNTIQRVRVAMGQGPSFLSLRVCMCGYQLGKTAHPCIPQQPWGVAPGCQSSQDGRRVAKRHDTRNTIQRVGVAMGQGPSFLSLRVGMCVGIFWAGRCAPYPPISREAVPWSSHRMVHYPAHFCRD